MRIVCSKILVSSLLVSSSMIYAASDTSNIAINVTYIEYLKFVGSAADSIKYLSPDDIRPATKNGPNPTLSLGTLGLESSVSGSCTLDFVTTNGFALKLNGKQTLTNYQLDYEGNTISPTNLTMVLPCNTAPTSIDFTAVGKIKNKLKAGVYSDIVTITATSQ